MSGIYIHIPFCHHKCTYCDFYFSVNARTLNGVVEGILKEIEERQNYLDTKKIESIYFGGGTPSILSVQHFEKIFNQLKKYFYWDDVEITVECNPEDVSKEYFSDLKSLGVNRISLGMQSLNDKVLQWMGRKHSAEQSLRSLKILDQVGIENFSVDIIFGVPEYDSKELEKDLRKLLSISRIPHISAYQLTVEKKTKLNYLVRTKKINLKTEDEVSEEFLRIQSILLEKNYQHYEVSNYALNGYIAKHNSAYWLQKNYLGVGPSAHSYNGKERRWNLANNYLYLNKIKNGEVYFEKEVLSEKQKFNEYVLTRLRTMYGCNINEIELMFGENYKKHFLNIYEKFKTCFEVEEKKTYRLKISEGYLLADKISGEFFV
ncbi:MAG TPA: radical SAM family heme chaperone HemW [Bacteroidia bacterium]|nr:radical SAM family heme chaperone HemW [Bacteroidia bacterium]